MTVSCGQIVERALRRLGVLGADDDVSATDMSVGMTALQEIVDSMRGGLFGRLRDVSATESMTAAVFDRVIGSTSGVTVSLPTSDNDEPIRDGAVVEVRNLSSVVSLNYRWNADTARWVLINGFSPTDALPIGANYHGAIVARLAMRLAGDFGEQVTAEIYRDAMAGARALAFANDSRDDWTDVL